MRRCGRDGGLNDELGPGLADHLILELEQYGEEGMD